MKEAFGKKAVEMAIPQTEHHGWNGDKKGGRRPPGHLFCLSDAYVS